MFRGQGEQGSDSGSGAGRQILQEAFQPGSKKASLSLSARDLIAFDSCVKCGSCVETCPVYAQTRQLEHTMGGFFSNLKSYVRKSYGLPAVLSGSQNAHRDMLKEYSGHSYHCTLCGRCAVVGPAFIGTKDLRIAARGFMVEKGDYPERMDRLAETLGKVHNILGEPNEDRLMWIQALGDVPESMYRKETAKTVYFVACVASYGPSPLTRRHYQAVRSRDDEWFCRRFGSESGHRVRWRGRNPGIRPVGGRRESPGGRGAGSQE